MNKTALEYAKENHKRLLNTLEPLMTNFPVAGFVYMEYLGPNDFFFMSSDSRWGDEYLMKGSPGQTWEKARLFAATQSQPTYLIWTLLESSDPLEQYCVDLGYRFGMNVYKKEKDKIRLWAFDGIDANCLHFFQTQKELIENFIFYFEEKCGDLFTAQQIQYNKAQWIKQIEMLPSSIAFNSSISPLPFPRLISLKGANGSVKLTLRQWEILKCLTQGLTMKGTGKMLGLSPRTIDYVLQVIKRKTHLMTRDQLVKLVKENSVSR